MVIPKVGFVVFGVHKDGLLDPMAAPFIDDQVITDAKRVLAAQGVDLVEHDLIVATKAEARQALKRFRDDDGVDGVVLFSGTWVWAAHLIGALRDYAKTGKGLALWTHPGSQGWRPVGGLVMRGAMKEVGIEHKFVYAAADDLEGVRGLANYCRAAHVKNALNMATIGHFGGRGMGQTCGVADPSQWMRQFGIDIDSRDTTELIQTAEAITERELEAVEPRIKALFGKLPRRNAVNERSIRLYLAIKKIVDREGWDFYTIQSFPGLADDYSATCFAQSMMLDDGYPTSTLGDFNTALTVLLMMKFSNDPVYYGDLQHIDTARKEIKIIGDGACPPSLACDLGPAEFAEHGIPTEGEAGGLSVSLLCREGQGALARLGRASGEFDMVVVPCTVFNPPPEELLRRRQECGIPFWPHAFVTYEGRSSVLLEHWNNEYACLGYGEDIVPCILEFCALTGIDAIQP